MVDKYLFHQTFKKISIAGHKKGQTSILITDTFFFFIDVIDYVDNKKIALINFPNFHVLECRVGCRQL